MADDTDTTTTDLAKSDALRDRALVIFRKGAPLADPVNCGLILSSKMCKGMLDRAWPGDPTPNQADRKTRQLVAQAKIAIATSDNPAKLLSCTGPSVLDSLVAIASLDLPLTKALGQVFLVPFGGVCTPMVGYKGFITLLVNTGFITHIESVLVYEGELFEYSRDEHGPHWNHVPDITLQGQHEKVVACYAIGYTRTGSALFEPMNRAELEHVRAVSKMAGKGAYKEWRSEMYRKAPIRRIQKYIPKSGDNLGQKVLARALEIDNQMYDLERRDRYAQLSGQYGQQKRLEADADWDRRLSRAEAAKKAADGAADSGNGGEKPEAPPTTMTVQDVETAIVDWLAANRPDVPDPEDQVYALMAALAVRATGDEKTDWTDPAPWTAEVCGKCAADLQANGLDRAWLPDKGKD